MKTTLIACVMGILVLFAVCWLWKADSRPWRGFYFVGGNQKGATLTLTETIMHTGPLNSEDECLAWAKSQRLRNMNAKVNYEDVWFCGKDCTRGWDGGWSCKVKEMGSFNPK